MIRHFISAQFLRFLAVGGTAAMLNWLARVALSLWLPFAWAVVLAYGVGMSAAFVLNRMFVFPSSSRPVNEQLRDFMFVNMASFPIVWISAMAIDAALRRLGMFYYTQELAHGIAIALPMLATFLVYKFFAFKDLDHGKS